MYITKHSNELCSLLGKGRTPRRFDEKFSFLTLEFRTSCRASNNESATQYAADCGDTPTDDDDPMTGSTSGITLSLRCSLCTVSTLDSKMAMCRSIPNALLVFCKRNFDKVCLPGNCYLKLHCGSFVHVRFHGKFVQV